MGPRRAAVWLCWLALTPLAGCRWLAAYEGAPDVSMADAPRLPDSQLADAADLAMREDVRVKDVAVKDTYPFDARIFGDGGVPPDCAPGPAPSCPTEQQATLYPTVDTILAAGGAGNNFETINVMNIGLKETQGVSVGVLRFNLATLPNLKNVDALIDMVLELSPAEQAADCGSAGKCGPCAALEHDGPFELRAMTNLWSAQEISWKGPTTATPWQQPAASDPTERGIVLARAFYRRGKVLSFVFPCGGAMKAELKHWVTTLSLSLQVVSLGGQIVAASREANSCPGSHLQPRLTVRWCEQ